MTGIRAGDLRHTVTVKNPVRTTDSMGGHTVNYSSASANIDSVPAAIWPLRGIERMEAMRTDAQITHRIRMRWHEDIGEDSIVVDNCHGFQMYHIHAVINIDMKNVYVDCMATSEPGETD